ncbi:YciI family protein [Arthrobacter gengyunqii]|uniref:YciI family protein n=1 Tax=Arthrobacter gengyunqii TaxID=2886940 RepID=A0A9X1M2T8_9MICC|nr:YciI family protein [Arthrobacter gengyunqii]MCC3266431.1 YciI family protein [Arthrobacter gengyunqii]MCC3269790.1 YciI family protein [Arthrobacter gengyunqii]UOY97240.1 YciI family protein [Arthrobacter gengyunqii]
MSIFAVEYVYDADSAALRDEHRPRHRQWLSGLAEEGRVLASGPFVDGAGALLIFTAEDEADLVSLLKQDPFAAVGAISGMKTTQWSPAVGAFAHLV